LRLPSTVEVFGDRRGDYVLAMTGKKRKVDRRDQRQFDHNYERQFA
jgi:hypothetical protein